MTRSESPYPAPCQQMSRRRAIRSGSLAVPGLTLASLLQSQSAGGVRDAGPSFGKAKNIIFLYLAGGPPQHETFDPKPEAPEGIRGPFKPISTNIPGIQFCELLPRTAAIADKLAVIRSVATDDNVHSSSGAWVLTGSRYRGPNARVISETDWPYFGSIVKRLKPADRIPALSTVWLPDVCRLNENVTPAGQTAGFMGSQWNPELFIGDPSAGRYEIESLKTTDVTRPRMHLRQDLLAQLNARFDRSDHSIQVYDQYQQQAFDLLTSGSARSAFNVGDEPDDVRNRYGRNRWGQCVLLARRLVEAGVRLVHVQWPREPGDNAVDNPLWDTHAQNADRVEDVLCPMFDVGFSALIRDLDQRGLLDETLVVAIGEFGRTPKINANGGRDHWGAVFSCVLAGAGISGGQVYGSSDRDGAYPETNRVEPGDLTASMFHLLGMDYQSTFPDRLGREHRLTDGEPLWKLLGDAPASTARAVSGGSVLRVPDYDPERHLLQTDFTGDDPVQPVTAASRPKGWRAGPMLDEGTPLGFTLVPGKSSGETHAALGIANRNSTGTPLELAGTGQAFVAQEVRSPFAGTYRLQVSVRPDASSPGFFDAVFLRHCRCEITFFQFNDIAKRTSERRTLASVEIVPVLPETDDAWQDIEISKTFVNPQAGGNFSFGAGMGIAIQISQNSDATVTVRPGEFAWLRVRDVKLSFVGKEVNDKVTV
ncbi:MAG: DUF1501 domain-containing protein [Planctomycetaceae bacterium]